MFDDCAPRIWSYVARMTGGDSAAVADTVQEVFLTAADRMASFRREQGTWIAWLLGIAHRQSALHWRDRERQQRLRQSVAERSPPNVLQALQVIDAERQETADAVRLIVAEMPEQAAALLVGRYLEDRSTAELAADFRISEQAVRSRLVRARERFRELFASTFHDLVPL